MKKIIFSILTIIVVICGIQACKTYYFRSAYYDENSLLHGTENLETKPFLKAHLKNGDVCILKDTWAVDITGNVVLGNGEQFDLNRKYEQYFTGIGETSEMVEIWVQLYNQAQTDLERLQAAVVRYSKEEISEKEMIDEILEICKFNGHAIGFFMANQIVKAGYEKEMLLNFHNPYAFYNLYNQSAKDLNLFQLSDEFMKYFSNIAKPIQ